MNFIRAIAFTTACVALMLSSGCGKGSQSSAGVTSSRTLNKSPKYKAQDAQLVQGSNNIQSNSTPDGARRAMRRAPDETVVENGRVVQYYNSDAAAGRSERLKLSYDNGRLINKEIVPADGGISDPTVVNTSSSGVVNVQGLEPANTPASNNAASRGYGTSNYYSNNYNTPRAGNASDQQNARSNDNFNQQLQRRY